MISIDEFMALYQPAIIGIIVTMLISALIIGIIQILRELYLRSKRFKL